MKLEKRVVEIWWRTGKELAVYSRPEPGTHQSADQ